MKKLIVIMLLCIGFSIGAWAQNAKADQYAKEITVAMYDLTNSKISMDTYVKKCEQIGINMGTYIATLDIEDIQPFLDHFYQCIYYHFAKYDFDKDAADMVISSFKESFYGTLNGDYTTNKESVNVAADRFAREFANIIEDSINGDSDEEEAEQVGFELGKYITKLTPSEVKSFQQEFYKALTVHVSRIPDLADLTHEEISELIDMFREQLDHIFEAFY